jgi:predicted Zn-dependent protease
VAKLSDKLAAALSAATGTTNVFTPKDIKLSFKLSSERLAKLKAEAEIYSRPREVKKPKAKFYKEILSIWTELLGCKLGRSTNSANERYGPCVRYFCSVARPVMGSAAPSEKYIPDLIDEEKKRRKDQ